MDHLCGFYSLLLRLSPLAGSHCPLQQSGGAAGSSVGIRDQGVWCRPQLTCSRQGSWLPRLASTLHRSISHILQSVYRWKLVSSCVRDQAPLAGRQAGKSGFMCFSTATIHRALQRERRRQCVCWAHRAQPKASFPLCWQHGGEQVGAAQPPLHQVLKVDVWFIADSRAPQKQQRLSPFSPPGEVENAVFYIGTCCGAK